MNQAQRKDLARLGGEHLIFDCPMDRYTTFRVGGNAEALYLTPDLARLQAMIALLGAEGVPFTVIGGGSNILVRDGGLPGMAILLRGGLSEIRRDPKDKGILWAGGGTGLRELTAFCREKGLSGLEFLAGIPGSVGGAVIMNAGAFGHQMADAVREVAVIDTSGRPESIGRSRLKFEYRKSSVPPGAVIVGTRLELRPDSRERIASRMRDCLRTRKEKQPLDLPSAGSVFKNPPGTHAGKLIEAAGLKGEKAGGAMISEKHANFIVNTGGAAAGDVLALIEIARKRVLEQTGIELELEIRVIGTDKA